MRIRTLLLLVCALTILSEAFSHRHHDHRGLYAGDVALFTPSIKDLGIADQVETTGSNAYTAIEHSGLSMLAPEGYAQTLDFRGFYYDKDTSIHVSEDSHEGFPSIRKKIKLEIAALTRYSPQDVTLLYTRNFTFNGYDATALYLYDEPKQLTYLYVAFGDDGFNVKMQGTCRAADIDNRDKILRAFLTASYNPTLPSA
jgi:hypothetical protein